MTTAGGDGVELLGAERALKREGANTWPWLASIRFGESLRLQVFPLLGLVYAGGDRVSADPWSAGLLIAGLTLLFAHIFAFNDLANLEADERDPRKSGRTFRRRGLSVAGMRKLVVGLGAAALSAFALLPVATWPYAAWFFLAGLLYSHPRLAMKAVPVASSVIHLVSGALHFLVGVSLYLAPDRDAFWISAWCGLALAAGHLMQEVEDHDGDRAAAVRTHAVAFGKRATYLAACAGFSLTFLYLAGLALAGVVARPLALLVVLYPPLVARFWRCWRRDLAPDEVAAIRRYYRALFAGVSLGIGVSFWLS